MILQINSPTCKVVHETKESSLQKTDSLLAHLAELETDDLEVVGSISSRGNFLFCSSLSMLAGSCHDLARIIEKLECHFYSRLINQLTRRFCIVRLLDLYLHLHVVTEGLHLTVHRAHKVWEMCGSIARKLKLSLRTDVLLEKHEQMNRMNNRVVSLSLTYYFYTKNY